MLVGLEANSSDAGATVDYGDFHKQTEADGYRPDLDHQFVSFPNELGKGIDCGRISTDIAGRTALLCLPLRICHGEHRGAGNGYGVRHILFAHGEELLKLEYSSVQDFICDVVNQVDAVYGNRQNRWLLVRYAEKNIQMHRILVIELHRSKECYNIITGWTREAHRGIKGVRIWERRDGSSRPGGPVSEKEAGS